MPTLTELATKEKRPAKKPATKTQKRATASKKLATRSVSPDVPWQKIADLYNAGKSTAEISDTLKLTRPKNQEGKENPYPYYLTVGYLTKLSHGVVVNGKTIKIERGKRKAKKDKTA